MIGGAVVPWLGHRRINRKNYQEMSENGVLGHLIGHLEGVLVIVGTVVKLPSLWEFVCENPRRE